MTGNNVLDHARRLLTDADDGIQRWPNPTLILYLNKSVKRLYAMRPDLLLAANDTLIAETTIVDGTESFSLDAKFLEPLAKAVAACALMEDSSDRANMQVGQLYEEQFIQEVNM